LQKPSLRDLHKRRTRQILREAALELFLAQGYDATTTEEVAAKAGVSVRTFFRYFETKDEVLFKGQISWRESVVEDFVKQPASMSMMEAMCATLVKLASGLNRESLTRYEQVVETSISLRGRSALMQRDNAERLSTALATRYGLDKPDATCRLFAGISVLLYRLAVDEWRLSRADCGLEDLIAEKFALLASAYDFDRPASGQDYEKVLKRSRRS
jgi:AcrR family transcriptional regulator